MKWLGILLVALLAGCQGVSDAPNAEVDPEIVETVTEEETAEPEAVETVADVEDTLEAEDEGVFEIVEIPESGVHIVEAGDTLFNISQRFGLDFWQVAMWNQIRLTDIVEEGNVVTGFRADISIGQSLVLENPILSREPVDFRVTTEMPTASEVFSFDLGGEGNSPALFFSADKPLRDLRLVTVQFGEFSFSITGTLSSFGDVEANHVIEFLNYRGLGTLPWLGFVFFDTEGNERLFTFDQSMMDGSFHTREAVHFNHE